MMNDEYATPTSHYSPWLNQYLQLICGSFSPHGNPKHDRLVTIHVPIPNSYTYTYTYTCAYMYIYLIHIYTYTMYIYIYLIHIHIPNTCAYMYIYIYLIHVLTNIMKKTLIIMITIIPSTNSTTRIIRAMCHHSNGKQSIIHIPTLQSWIYEHSDITWWFNMDYLLLVVTSRLHP